ncbi:unnamed protein product [Caenorhabditis nigoni]
MDSPEGSLPSLIEDDSPRFQYDTIDWNNCYKSSGISNVEVIELGAESQEDDEYSLTTSLGHTVPNYIPDLEMSLNWWNPSGFSNHYIFLPDSGIYDKLILKPWTSPSTEVLKPKYISNGLSLASMLTPLRKNLKLIKKVPTSEITKYIKSEDLEKKWAQAYKDFSARWNADGKPAVSKSRLQILWRSLKKAHKIKRNSISN